MNVAHHRRQIIIAPIRMAYSGPETMSDGAYNAGVSMGIDTMYVRMIRKRFPFGVLRHRRR